MSDRTAKTRKLRAPALVLALAGLAPTGASAQAGAGQAGTAQSEKSGGVKSFLNRLWSGISGKDKSSAAEENTDPASAADPAQPGQTSPSAESGTAPAQAPSLAQARWVGFTPVLAVAASEGDGAWLAGPFPEAGTSGWVTDTVSGLTVRVRLVWREAEAGSLAHLSAEAAAGLGLAPGAVANVAIYLDP
jgi:hypothetical protein